MKKVDESFCDGPASFAEAILGWNGRIMFWSKVGWSFLVRVGAIAGICLEGTMKIVGVRRFACPMAVNAPNQALQHNAYIRSVSVFPSSQVRRG